MSLNGLDDPKLAEAYQSALSEAGGWFLLKYVSRDEVEILQNGKGGLAECRAAVASYDKRSPLYGFLLYRRRKVLIKYIPEGTSRLLQARVSVHFTAVTDKFSPYDSIFPISAPEDLNDITLTAACALHTEKPPGSSHATASSPRKKLDEITEDAEEAEEESATTPLAEVVEQDLKPDSTPVAVAPVQETLPQTPPQASQTPSGSTVTESPFTAYDPSERRPSVTSISTTISRTPTTHSTQDSDSRLSSQTLRPSAQDLFNSGAFAYKPKVKLGPRPKQTSEPDGRPKTAGARPVSTLPAGLKIAPRKTYRPKSGESGAPPNIALPPPPPIPTTPTSLLQHSPVSVRSLPAVVHHQRLGSPGLTTEKQRLMKAVELRKKQMKAKQEREAAAAAAATTIAGESPAAPSLPPPQVVVSRHSVENPPQPGGLNSVIIEEISEEISVPVETVEEDILEDRPLEDSPTLTEHIKSDSGVEIRHDTNEVEEHSSTIAASSPTSIQDSSTEQSTRPSSVSEEELLPSTVYVPSLKKLQVDVENDKVIVETEKDDSTRESLESSPTVVPENGSPVPSVARSADDLQANAAENLAISPSTHLTPADELDDPLRGRDSGKPKLRIDSSPSMSRAGSSTNRREKRRAIVEPLSIHVSTDNSEEDYLSDEEFMDELQSATVQEAKPISVSKSPISPFFPNRKGSAATISIINNRPGSSPDSDRLTPRRTASGRNVLELARSFSGASATSINSQGDHMAVANKANVSTGISQRIKALAEKSNRESTATVGALPVPEGSPGAGLTGSELSKASMALFQNPAATQSSLSMGPPPPRETVHATVYNVEQRNYRPESVSVTARIIRDDRMKKPDLSVPNEHSPLELHQSPLIIDHQPASNNPSRLSVHTVTNPVSSTPASPISTESSTPILPRSSSENSWRTLGRRRSEAKSPPPLLRNHSEGSVTTNEDDVEKKKKRESRTSRLMKRMSSGISGASRKSLAQVITPSLKEEEQPAAPPPQLLTPREVPQAIQVGDLNVQFPDTLLWKRRYVEIDHQGNLVLSVSRTNDNVRGVTKKFHLTELRAPYIPDQDRQELPNSVLMDFLDGSTLQCACETYAGQAQVLQILRESHAAWLAFTG